MGLVENLIFFGTVAKIVKIGSRKLVDEVFTDYVMSCFFYGPQCIIFITVPMNRTQLSEVFGCILRSQISTVVE